MATDTESVTGSTDAETARVEEAIHALVAEHDPAMTDPFEFRGHRYDRGLAWVHFPVGEGGLGVRPELNRLVERTLAKMGAPSPDPTTFFMALAGPTIVTHGTAEQKQRLLRPMFTGEEKWCQLFSEPGAGSDMAGLACKAVRDGEEWVVNGQKVWNTLAHLGDWGMLVARSDPNVPKHRGLTYFAVDMHAEGVDVRPLRQITGEAEFNEVYLTDVRISDENRIGDEGQGWGVSMTTLMNERTAIGGGSGRGPGSGPIGDAIVLYNELPEGERTAAVRDRLMGLYTKSEVLRLTNQRASENAKVGNPGPEGSVAKLAYAELNKAVYELCIDLLGPAGQIDFDYTYRRSDEIDVAGGDNVRKAFLRVRANSIEGGTSEIMRNILGERVLGLPGEPRVDKTVPWIEVPRS